MNSVVKGIETSQRHINNQLYFTARDKIHGRIELSDIPTEEEIEFEVQEVRIKLPWNNGILAGKWWGPKSQRPIVCIHGWQDNAGTFDKLIPLLPRDQSFLAIDLPGHGLSSRVPDGMAYHDVDNLYILNFLMKEYKWEKLSLMSHSLGSQISFMFASTFPDIVDLLIQIDSVKPPIIEPERIAATIQKTVKNFMVADSRNQLKSEPPTYTYEDMIEKVYMGTGESVTKETANYLLKRNIKRSEKYPGKFYFNRDSRLKYNFSRSQSQSVSVEMAKKLKMPHIFIKALQSPYYERKVYFDEIIDILKRNEKFEIHFVDSTHHLHLTEPEKVAPILSKFIEKHRRINSKL